MELEIRIRKITFGLFFKKKSYTNNQMIPCAPLYRIDKERKTGLRELREFLCMVKTIN